ncbi:MULTISPECIES: tyrosine-type recombinase/integrase [unclassified Pseudomonas]|uniref:tyrosine-type recombinase/integrase n=1 Tax=unclassified Pseudomonas TaxID=196821 RepID=UPI002B23515D|nr:MULTISPECIES: tyrosine-type recombinase/integrase [unclassified Pseudomonas]MEA9976301.1 tyrosine-type recombinase/integrase [Pseudomonas sp. RTS4]MEB0197633.1 tyrosine-type recombinase/integrase [Pseudomonas sp. 5S4]MEB0246121.1 tyrosine-type recombinase/integrase [Pseudomonas sp. 10S5]
MTEMEAYAVKTRQSEPVGSRGKGTLLLERKASGAILAYYRERTPESDKRLSLGTLTKKPKAGTDERVLDDMRAEALRVSLDVAAAGGLVKYLECQVEQKASAEAEKIAAAESVEVARLERQRLAEIEASRGTLGDLFLDYIEDRRGKATPGVVKELERLFKTNLKEPHPTIIQMKARDIRADHILIILNPIWARGSKVQADRMRSFLVAAFNHGLTVESVVGRSNSKVYSLELNPAAMVKVEKVSAPIERALSDTELRQFWETIQSTEGIGPVMALLFKFVIATGGQRIKNIIETPWADYDLEAGTVLLAHRKGRGGQTMSRPHLVPLTERAVVLMRCVQKINGDHLWPWTTHGKQPFVISSPTHAVADWLTSKHAVIDGAQLPNFSPRDLRRTCTQLMQKHGVDDRLSDLLQAHGQTGVVSKHYRNNPEAALPEKRRAIELFDRALAKVLGEAKDAGNVLSISRRKKRITDSMS